VFPEGNCTRKSAGKHVSIPVSPCFRRKLLSTLYQHPPNGHSAVSTLLKIVFFWIVAPCSIISGCLSIRMVYDLKGSGREILCEISGSHGGEYEDQGLLGCTVVFSNRCRPTFQRCVLPPSSGRSLIALMMEAARISETSVGIDLRT
jgi:hypothetical protein